MSQGTPLRKWYSTQFDQNSLSGTGLKRSYLYGLTYITTFRSEGLLTF